MTTPRMEPSEIVESINQCVDMTWSALEDHGHDRPGDHEREDWFDSFYREAVHCAHTLDNSFARMAEWNRNPEPPSIDFIVSKYRQEMLDRIRAVCGPSVVLFVTVGSADRIRAACGPSDLSEL